MKAATRQVSRPTPNGDSRFAEIVAAADFDWGSERDRRWLAANIVRSQNAGRQAWADYDRLGEVHKAISRAARIAGYARLRCVEVTPDGKDGKTIETGLPAAIVEGIYAPYGGVRGLIDRFFALMKVPGDSYLIRFAEGGDYDGYHFLSSDEIQRASVDQTILAQLGQEDIKWVTLPASSYATGPGDTALTRDVAGEDMLGRVWLPGRRWVDVPDSPLAALATECEVLWGLTETMKANILSRFALAGMMAFPSEIQDVKVAGMAQSPNQDLLSFIMTAMQRNVQSLGDASVRLPILLKAKGDSIEQIKHITIDREIFANDIALRNELIERILFGLDIQVQATKGMEESNHFSSWMQSDEEVRIAVQPDLDTMCWALTRLVLHRQLADADFDPARIVQLRIAWDMSDSAARTNKQDDSRQGWDRGLVGGNAVVRAAGLSVIDDRMSEQEYIRWTGIKQENTYLTLFEGDSIADIDWEEAAKWSKTFKPGPTASDTEQQPPAAGPGVGEPGAPSPSERDRTRRETPTPSG